MRREVLEKLEGKFSSSKTPTGHKLLPPCIRVIQGDGIDIQSLEMILKAALAVLGASEPCASHRST